MDTICRDCVFANFQQGVQVGCQLGRLAKFEEKELIEDKYFKINGYCSTCRNADWKQKNKDKTIYEDLDERLNIDVVITLCPDNTFEDLELTINSLLKQKKKPNHFYLINRNLDLLPSKLNPYFVGLKRPWTIDHILDENTEECVAIANRVKKLSNLFVAVVRAGKVVPAGMFKKVNDIVNRDFNQVSLVVEKDSEDWVIAQTILYQYVAKTYGPEGIIPNIKFLAEEQKCPQNIIYHNAQ